MKINPAWNPIRMKAAVVLVMSSLYRDANLTRLSLMSAASCSDIDKIIVHGYTPMWPGREEKVDAQPIASSPVHAAYRWLSERDVPTQVVAGGNKKHTRDPLKRARWRSQLCLDAWYALDADATTVIWLENDGIIDCDALRTALQDFRASQNAGASCFGKDGTLYPGEGTVCMMFRGSDLADIRRHILGYHMVQPLDWILGDYSAGKWRVYNVASHGRPGHKHTSTLVL